MVKFSIFLPAFKAAYLNDAIDSIVHQHCSDWELIIVNDGSPEDISRIVLPYCSDPRIKYFENEQNLGAKDLVGFWNSNIARCNGEYIVFASDDDVYDLDYLQEMRRLSDLYPECNLLHCRVRHIDGQGRISQLAQTAATYETQADFIYQTLVWGRRLTLQECCFKKEPLKQAGGLVRFPLAWYSDWATAFLLAQCGVVYSQKVLLSFRMSRHNLSEQGKNCCQKIEAMKQFALWLDSFLPSVNCASEDDRFLNNRTQRLYKDIVYSHYHQYLPSLDAQAFFREMRFIRNHHIFTRKTRASMFLRHFLFK